MLNFMLSWPLTSIKIIHHKCKCRSIFKGPFHMIWTHLVSRLWAERGSTNQNNSLWGWARRVCIRQHFPTHTHMALTPPASISGWCASWPRLPLCWCCSGHSGWASVRRCLSGSTIFPPISSIYLETSCWEDSFPSTSSPATSPRGQSRTTSAVKGEGWY